jgi:hypothetical protein
VGLHFEGLGDRRKDDDMTDHEDATFAVNRRLDPVGDIGPAPGDSGELPDRIHLGEVGPFVRLVAFDDIPPWSGRGAPPPICWIVWNDGKGHRQLVLAIDESAVAQPLS